MIKKVRKIKRTLGDFRDLGFTLDLTNMGKTHGDLEDIFFSIKSDVESDDDVIFFKKKSDGGIETTAFAGDQKFNGVIKWSNTEYDNFVAGSKYKAGIFPKFTGDPVATENPAMLIEIEIVKDFLKQN